jgi:hypothetical protein
MGAVQTSSSPGVTTRQGVESDAAWLADEVLDRPELLRALPAAQVSPEVVRAACLGDWRAIAYVAPEQRSLQACLQALEATPLALVFVPDELLGQEAVVKAVRERAGEFEPLWPTLEAARPAVSRLREQVDDEIFWSGVAPVGT